MKVHDLAAQIFYMKLQTRNFFMALPLAFFILLIKRHKNNLSVRNPNTPKPSPFHPKSQAANFDT